MSRLEPPHPPPPPLLLLLPVLVCAFVGLRWPAVVGLLSVVCWLCWWKGGDVATSSSDLSRYIYL